MRLFPALKRRMFHKSLDATRQAQKEVMEKMEELLTPEFLMNAIAEKSEKTEPSDSTNSSLKSVAS